MRRARGSVALALVLATLSGCATGSGGTVTAEDGPGAASRTEAEKPAFPESEANSVVAFTLSDYHFEGPTTVRGPKVVFTADNEGTEDHELEILDSSGEAVGEIEAFAPGAVAEALHVTLAPGKYVLQCILTTSGGQEHKSLGMVASLRVE